MPALLSSLKILDFSRFAYFIGFSNGFPLVFIGVRRGGEAATRTGIHFSTPRKRVGACVSRTSGAGPRTWLPRAHVRQGARPGRPNPGAARSCGFSRVRVCVCVRSRIPPGGSAPLGRKPQFHPKSALLGSGMLKCRNSALFGKMGVLLANLVCYLKKGPTNLNFLPMVGENAKW